MFRRLTLRGRSGSIVFGGRPAAVIRSWVARRTAKGAWQLSAFVDRVDTFRVRQIPLLFEAPRESTPRGVWCFPVVPNSVRVDGAQLTADLGQPEG